MIKMRYCSHLGGPPAGVKIDLLWTNQSPGTSFAAQTVVLDLAGYDFVMVLAATGTTAVNAETFIALVDDGASYNIFLRNYNTSTQYNYLRRFTVDNSGVTFASGLRDTTENNTYAIPQKIFGIKL